MDNKQPKEDFNTSISRLMTERLQKYIMSTPPTIGLCIEVYQEIFNALGEVFEQSGVGLTNEAVNYIAQSYYDSIITGDGEDDRLNPHIFTQRASLKNIPTTDLGLMATMLKNTKLFHDIIYELKGR
jgi:hypothetical protein